MSSSSPTLSDWRELFTRRCRSSVAAGVHSVTFQPTPGALNEDRFVAQEWLIHGRPWKFLAVFDGHGGPFTAEYAAANVPRLIEEELRDVLEECQGRSQNTLIEKVKKLLRQKIEDFDEDIGDAVKNLCSDPLALSYPEAQDLVDANRDVFQRAFSGSTLALALIDEERNNLWVAGLGDSTVALACEDQNQTGYSEALLTVHNTRTPKEYLNIAMMHPSEEKDTVMEDGLLLGVVPYTRCLGEYALKLPAGFSMELFFKLPRGQRPRSYWDGVRHYNVTPPYVLNAPGIRHIDLAPLRQYKATLVLYTCGVDAIVNSHTRRTRKQNKPDPAAVVGTLVGSRLDEASIQETLNHGAELSWTGNRATELLGNLMAGTSAELFAKFLGPGRNDRMPDTTILRYDLVRDA
ncbi:protein serine/threonine phosphatase 2C [Armillaria novae-zelandiae]|uniref:Protein serine/threonine phosphatase 2C n=1 Tax=Armillaria novae-zelandiae TaxID=153914 RepID=A0AA39NNX9_9AGAR|nr:protein serine/threonine phosphatase 2C [Armillaria novae-zelandiae]KAK0468878.1 protein serine/threonine phosphatase 2C [Armillaria novae-zelandiae]